MSCLHVHLHARITLQVVVSHRVGLNSGPLEEQPVPLAVEPSVHPNSDVLWIYRKVGRGAHSILRLKSFHLLVKKLGITILKSTTLYWDTVRLRY